MGCLLRGIKREQVQRGQVITIPNSIESVKQFKASIYVRRLPIACLFPLRASADPLPHPLASGPHRS